jgi:hypothetical protein
VPADRQIEGDDGMRPGEGRLDIAVTGAKHQRFRRPTGRETAESPAGVQYGLQHIRLDRNQLGSILGQIRIGREHGSDRLADIAQPLPREEWLAIGAQRLGGRVAKIDRRQVGYLRRRPYL